MSREWQVNSLCIGTWNEFIHRFRFSECFFVVCVCVCVKSVANTVQMTLSWQAAARMSSIGRLKCHLVSNSTVERGSTCKNLHNFCCCCCCFCYCLLFNECFGYFREKTKQLCSLLFIKWIKENYILMITTQIDCIH